MASVEGWSVASIPMESARPETDFAALVETHSRLLYRVAHSVLRSRAEAEDVVQDVFVRIIERRSGLHDVRDMRVWLIRIAWNLALDRRRRIRPEQIDQDYAAIEELGTSEIAAVLGKSESAVRALVFRAMTRLRERLEREVSR